VEIVEEAGAFLLLYFSSAGECIKDTWHPTLDAAKAQADFEFELAPPGWVPIGQ
jgi:hypothetical protein